MRRIDSLRTRRHFLKGMAAGVGALSVPGLFAQELVRTPRQTEGPFYPDRMPLDTDNDLLIINDALDAAVGEITHLSGRILDARGEPVRNAVVEIWQVDSRGVYLHTGSSSREKLDANFQGFGRFLTGSNGGYYFRTIKPVPYRAGNTQRTPHIHFAVRVKGNEQFTTQLYVKGEPENEQDSIFRAIRDPKARAAVMSDFAPVQNSRIGELATNFDIVLGFTPQL
ncbi:MAG: twin-arginine translocation signal domain-containing protein [Acidobacteriota bacterium]